MGGSAPTPPTPPNPSDVANTQQQYNQGAWLQSMFGQNNPYASLSYTQTGTGPNGLPLYTANVSLNPKQQQLLDALRGQSLQLMAGANYGGISPAQAIGGPTSGATQALLGQEVSYLNPFFQQQTSQLDAQLKNQGLDPSHPAYKQAMNNLLQSQNQGVTGFLAQAEPAAFQQSMQTYLAPLSITQGLQSLEAPNYGFVQTPQGPQPPNYQADVYNTAALQQQNYANQMQQYGNMMQGMFGIPTAILGGWARGGGLQSLGSGLMSLFA